MFSKSAECNTKRTVLPLNNGMQPPIVKPIIITSPISGQPSKPTLATFVRGNKTIVEATWRDPASGAFIRKGVVSVDDVKKA